MLIEFVAKYLISFLIAPIILIGLLGQYKFSLKSLIALSITTFIIIILKELTNQPRPYIRSGKKSLMDDPPTDKSFPSGHTAASMTAAVSLFYFNSIIGITLIIASIIVGISRIMVHIHTWYDVLIGAIMGATIAIAVHSYLFN